jgi:hypothetical protein
VRVARLTATNPRILWGNASHRRRRRLAEREDVRGDRRRGEVRPSSQGGDEIAVSGRAFDVQLGNVLLAHQEIAIGAPLCCLQPASPVAVPIPLTGLRTMIIVLAPDRIGRFACQRLLHNQPGHLRLFKRCGVAARRAGRWHDLGARPEPAKLGRRPQQGRNSSSRLLLAWAYRSDSVRFSPQREFLRDDMVVPRTAPRRRTME